MVDVPKKQTKIKRKHFIRSHQVGWAFLFIVATPCHFLLFEKKTNVDFSFNLWAWESNTNVRNMRQIKNLREAQNFSNDRHIYIQIFMHIRMYIFECTFMIYMTCTRVVSIYLFIIYIRCSVCRSAAWIHEIKPAPIFSWVFNTLPVQYLLLSSFFMQPFKKKIYALNFYKRANKFLRMLAR